jgi:hypothetical protein
MADIESNGDEHKTKAKMNLDPLPQVVISPEGFTQHADLEEEARSRDSASAEHHPETPPKVGHNDKAMEEPIFNLAWDCDELMDKCFHHTQDESNLRTSLEQYKRSFDAWSKYLGVFAARDTNLDRRLIRKDGVRDIVIRLLLILKQNLVQRKIHEASREY